MPPVRLGSASQIPSDQLQDWGPVAEPVGERIGRVRGRSALDRPVRVGVWECSPGRWRRRVMEPEFAHFVAGYAIFTPDDGEPMVIQAGDAVWFPANTTGTWDITEKLRKTYVVIPPTGLMPKLRILARRARRLTKWVVLGRRPRTTEWKHRDLGAGRDGPGNVR
jgi:uncharacterized cupin superfamily protein